MINHIPIILALLLVVSCKAAVPPQNHTHSEPSINTEKNTAMDSLSGSLQLVDDVSSWTLGYYTPPFKKDSLYPLIIYLHGGIGTERTDKGEKAWTMYQFITDSFPAIIASPSANRFAPWWSETGVRRILTSVDQICLKFPVDRSKIFLAGVSDGATGAVAVSSLPNHPFAGFIGSAAYPPMFGNGLDISSMKKTPLFLYICGKDRLYPVDSVVNWCKERQSAGVPVEYKVMPDAEHGFDFKVDEKTEILSLLSKWKRIE